MCLAGVSDPAGWNLLLCYHCSGIPCAPISLQAVSALSATILHAFDHSCWALRYLRLPLFVYTFDQLWDISTWAVLDCLANQIRASLPDGWVWLGLKLNLDIYLDWSDQYSQLMTYNVRRTSDVSEPQVYAWLLICTKLSNWITGI